MLGTATTITTLEYIFGAILAILAVALIILIGQQKSKRRGLGNSIAGQGASESYINKHKIGNKDKLLQKITIIVASVFVVLVVALYVVGTVEPKDDAATSTDSTVDVA
jgi:protein translocase SecG subunit